MGVTKLNSIKLGDMEAYYVLDEEKQAVELMLLPEGMQEPEWLSGDVTHLSDEQWAVIDQGIQSIKRRRRSSKTAFPISAAILLEKGI